MAITVNTEPISLNSGLSISYAPIVYTFESDSVDIQYCIVEVLIDNVRVSARSVQPDLGTTDEFTLDISSDCQNYLSFTLETLGSNGVISGSTGLKEIKVKFYEVNLTDGLLVTAYDPSDPNNTNNDAISQTSITYNWTENNFSYNSFSFDNYNLTDNTKLFLTDSPSVKSIELLQNEFIGILRYAGVASKAYKLEVLTYDSSNALLNTDYINITEWDSAYILVPTDTYLSIAVGTQNLINEGISLTNVDHYTIQVINVDGDVSELKRFNIVASCDYDTRVHWVNKFGKQDSYTFKGNKIEGLDYKSDTFQKAKGITYDSSSRGISTIQNVTSNNFTAFTDSVGRDTYDFLKGLLTNNMAWVEIDNTYFPITIDNGSKLVLNERNMPIQFVLDYKFSNLNKGLRG